MTFFSLGRQLTAGQWEGRSAEDEEEPSGRTFVFRSPRALTGLGWSHRLHFFQLRPPGPTLPLQLWWKGKTCLESLGQAPCASEPALPHREGDMLSLLSGTHVESDCGNAQRRTQLARAAFGACSDSGAFGWSFQPFQPQQWLSLPLVNPSPLLFIHGFGIRPGLPCDISSVGGVCVF